MTFKQMLYGPLAALVLLFGFYTVTGAYEAHKRTDEILVLIARTEKLERSVNVIAESQIKLTESQVKSQEDVAATVGELQKTIYYLTRVTELATKINLGTGREGKHDGD